MEELPDDPLRMGEGATVCTGVLEHEEMDGIRISAAAAAAPAPLDQTIQSSGVLFCFDYFQGVTQFRTHIRGEFQLDLSTRFKIHQRSTGVLLELFELEGE